MKQFYIKLFRCKDPWKADTGFIRCLLGFVFIIVFSCYNISYTSAQCSGSEKSVLLYQTYGIDYDNAMNITAPENSLGYPDADFANLSSGLTDLLRGSIDIELSELVEFQDTVWIRAASSNPSVASDFRVRSSLNGTTFSNTELYTTSNLTPNLEYPYIVQNPAGIRFIQVQCTHWTIDLFLESVKQKIRECREYCVPLSINYSNGFGVAISANTSASDSLEALGAPDKDGATIDGTINGKLIIDLGDTIPYESNIVLYVAHNGSPAPFVVSGAIQEPFFGNTESYVASKPDDIYVPVHYQVQLNSGIRFIKVQVYEDSLAVKVDAVEYYHPDLFGSAAISGLAFNDVNGNGVANFGETTEDSVTVNLYRDLNGNGVVDVFDELLATTITDTAGSYTFTVNDYDLTYIVKIDRATLPFYVDMTTPVQQSFSGLDINESYCLDFGFQECLASCAIYAEDDIIQVIQNSSLNTRVLNNDIGPVDSTSVSIMAARQPQNGVASVLANGSITYKPNPYFSGIDSLAYIVCSNDIVGDCDTAFVLLNVYCPTNLGQYDISGAIFDDQDVDGKFVQGEEWSLPSNIKIYLRADLNGNGAIDLFDNKIDSVLTAGDGTYSFTVVDPNASYIVEADPNSGPANLGFTTPLIRGIGPFDGNIVKCGINFGLTFCGPLCPPLAIPDEGVVASGVASFINVLNNDLDFDYNLDPFSLQIISPPSHGKVVIGRDGMLVYSSDATYVGTDQFTYQICDQTSPTPLCSSTTVDFEVIVGYDDPCAEATRTHTYYMPYPENELRTALINSASFSCRSLIDNIARSISTIKSPYPGVEIYYDHWEDGYESNLLNPIQNSTVIWGDEDLSNGIAPGYPTDFIPAGGSIILDNNIFFNPRIQMTLLSMEKIKSTQQVMWPSQNLPVISINCTYRPPKQMCTIQSVLVHSLSFHLGKI